MPEADDEISRQKNWALDRAFSFLEESFETIVVIAASPIPGDRTMKLVKIHGDAYACIGMAMTFAKSQMDYLNGLRGDENA